MKTVLRTWGVAFLAAALMTGCGSDNATGGGGSGSSNSDLLTGSSSSNTKSWSEFKREVDRGNFQGSSVPSSSSTSKEFMWRLNGSSSSGGSNCSTKKFLGIPYTYCSYSGSGSVTGGGFGAGTSARIVERDGSVYPYNFAEDDFGNSLAQIKNTLVSRMNNATDIRRCVTPRQHIYEPGNQFYPVLFANEEYCYFIDGRTVGTVGTVSYVDHANLRFLLRNETSKRYIFVHNQKTYLVDTSFPLAANPIGIQVGSSVKLLSGSN